jgi:uncharacterized protein YndB with AHSA1/START domain
MIMISPLEGANMATIHHELRIEAPVARVYDAIATADGISAWWDKQTPRQTDNGLVLEHNPGVEHGIVQLKVVDLVPLVRIEWECISTHSPTSPASAWTGTHFTFELTSIGQQTKVDFLQTGYDENSQFFTSNRDAWRTVLDNLKRVLESQP